MTSAPWLTNLTAYSLQVAALVAAAGLLVAVLRVRAPRVRLAIWQALLLACLALPLIQPWRAAPAAAIDPASAAGSFAPFSQPVEAGFPGPRSLRAAGLWSA